MNLSKDANKNSLYPFKHMILMSNSTLRLIVCLVVVMFLSGCDAEEAPLQFDVIENTSPETTKLEYHAQAGPFPGVNEYYIHTNYSASEVKLHCNNCKHLVIDTYLDKPYAPESGGTTSTEATPEESGIYVTLSEGNTVTVTFTPLIPLESAYGYYGKITATGKIGGKEVQTVINIHRRNPLIMEGL